MLSELYKELILDHNKSPRNRREMESPSHEADGHNPLCGDQVHVYASVRDGVVEDVSFVGHGCAISTASASLMTEALKGRTVDEADAIFQRFHAMLTDENALEGFPDEGLEKLEAFAGVREFPMRVKCATLAWHTFNAAIHGEQKVSTE